MWKIKYLRLCMLGLCLLLMWYGSAACQKKMEWFDNSVSVRWESGKGVSPAQMSQVLERQIKAGGELPSFVLWTSHYEQILYGDFYPNPVNGEVFEYYGDISRLQLCRFRYGYWSGDEKVCVIDEGTAHALWGSSDVLGQTIQWNERTWYVCGVVEGMDGLAFFPAEEMEERMFQGLWLNLSEEQGGTYAAEQILQKYQLPVVDMTDLGLYVWLSQILAALPAFLLWAWTLMRIARRLWKLRYTWLLFLDGWISVECAGPVSAYKMVGWFLLEQSLYTGQGWCSDNLPYASCGMGKDILDNLSSWRHTVRFDNFIFVACCQAVACA